MAKKKDDVKTVKILALVFGWLFFILVTLIFVFYFIDKLPFSGDKKDKKTPVTSNQKENTQEDKTEEDKTEEGSSEEEPKSLYEVNANSDINKLIADYYKAVAECDQDMLMELCLDDTKFVDMTMYETKAELITDYSNICCYTVKGCTEDATLVYVTSNLSLVGVESKPMEIKQLYVRETPSGYKIDNTDLDDNTEVYIEKMYLEEEIQALYTQVQEQIDDCIENDENFAGVYEKLF